MNAIIQPSRSSLRKLSECNSLKDAFSCHEFGERIGELAGKHMDPVRLYRIMMLAANKSPKIYEVPVRQVLGQLLTVAGLGLEPNTPHGHVYLIPFEETVWNKETRKRDKKQMSLQIVTGYQGFAELFWRSGIVTRLHADVVLPGDEFDFSYGTDAFLKHKPMGRASENDSPSWAYVHLDMMLGQGVKGQSFEVMPWQDVLRIRNNSQAYRKALAAKEKAEKERWNLPAAWTEAPWIKHEREMGKKTPLRRLAKTQTKTPEIAGVTAMEEAQEQGRRLDWGLVIDGKANILEGGIPESEDQEDPAPVTADAAFGDRRPQEEDRQSSAPAAATNREQSRQQPVQEGRAGAGQTAQERPQTSSQMSEADGFEGWLSDENGEALTLEPIVDPVEFALNFEKHWQNSKSRETLIENNRDFLESAAEVSPRAKAIIDSLMGSPAGLVVIPAPEGRAGWASYIKAFQDSLGTVPAEQLDEWAVLQGPALHSAPQPVKLRLSRLVVDHASRNKVPVPEVIRIALQTRAAPAPAPENATGSNAQSDAAPPADKGDQAPAKAETKTAGDGGGEPDKAKREAATRYVANFAQLLGSAVEHARREGGNAQIIDYLGQATVQRQLASLKSGHSDLYGQVLQLCMEDLVFGAVREFETAYPAFHDDVVARKVAPPQE